MSNVMVWSVPVPAGSAEPVAASRQPSPNYVLRRTVALCLVVVVALVLAVAASGLLAGFGGDPASASEARPASLEAAYHVAAPGESLWTIAVRHHGEVALDRYVDALVDLNGGAVIQVGQAVWLP
jgi:hypothetical protein